MKQQIILEVKGVNKSFPGVKALDNVSMEVRRGEVHALLGENGAGKSTLMKILAGVYQPDSGEIFIRGRKVVLDNPKTSRDMGIGMVHQELHLNPHQTVMENIFMGREPSRKFGFIDGKHLYKQTADILERLERKMKPNQKVGELSIAEQQMVEIAKAISLDADLIIMDEPTSSVTEEEREVLFSTINRLRKQGVAIIYISHRMEEIFEIADRATIMRDGQTIETRDLDENVTIDQIISSMVGRKISYVSHQRKNLSDDVVLSVKNLSREGVCDDISFDLKYGEVLGIAGLVGAGRTEIMRCIFGLDKKDTGTIMIEGKECDIKSPKDAIELGIGFVTEDRKVEGLVLSMSVGKNITMSILERLCKFNFIDDKKAVELAKEYIERLSIRTPSYKQIVENLSGGNQQKVVIAKWLLTQPKVLILDEPTRGIDVGAKNEIYKLMNQLSERGIGIIMISSELPEILRMSDRILVIREGRITASFDSSECSQERIMKHAL